MEPGDQLIRLHHGERWFVDGFAVMPTAGGFLARMCDMTQAQAALQALRAQGLPATYTHLCVRAAALALQRCPEAQEVVCGYRRLRPARVDIGLSMSGQTNYAPVVLIPDAAPRLLPQLVAFLSEAVPQAREKEARDLAGMRRNGWIIPLGPLRRLILRLLNRSLWFRRRIAGTFQITCMPQVDFCVPFNFYSGCALGVGRVQERVLAQGGQAVVRPSLWLTVAIDHKTMDGRPAAALLGQMAAILESDELLLEAGGTPQKVAAPTPLSLPAA